LRLYITDRKIIVRSQSGFSLLELAIVLFVLALMLGGLLMPLASRLEVEERKQTEDRLVEIREVIYGYALQNGRLPCSDCEDNSGNCGSATANDGMEDRITAGANLVCASEVGNLPWVTLGVQGVDSWNRLFTYRVDGDFADGPGESPATPGSGTCTQNLSVSFTLCDGGDITVKDGDAGSNVATGIAAIIVSHGRNGGQTPSTDEEENYDDSSNANDALKTFVDKDYSQQAGAEYDDLLIWISPHVLRNRMLQAGLLP
jgi:prepilin-type N-terminal cleavage/methylation domain-containing protein